MVRVSVIIPVYNDAQRLQACLEALDRQTFPREMMEVIVVDNGSKETPKSIVENYPFCRLEKETKSGSYAARNRGLQVATGEIIAFTDSDCLPIPEWLANGVAVLTAAPHCDIAGGDIQIFPELQHSPKAVELYDVAFGLPQEQYVKTHGKCMTANLFTRRTVFDRVGGFDEFVFGGGDHLWSLRVVEDGGVVRFAESAVVRHPARKTIADLIRQARREVGGRVDHRKREPYRRSWWFTLKIIVRMYFPNFGENGACS